MTNQELAPPSSGQDRVVAEFRSRGGKVGGYHATMELLLLTTTGARTGQRRAVPLTYAPDGDRYIVTAGNAGSDRHPAWYHNLIANPDDVTVEVGDEAFKAVAVIADEPERRPSTTSSPPPTPCSTSTRPRPTARSPSSYSPAASSHPGDLQPRTQRSPHYSEQTPRRSIPRAARRQGNEPHAET